MVGCDATFRSEADRWFTSAVEAEDTRDRTAAVSYTHLRAHETVLDLVCRLLLEKKKKSTKQKTAPPKNKLNILKQHTRHVLS